MALIDLLNATITNYSDTDPDWRQFVLDHKLYLLSNSTPRNVSSGYLQAVRYSMSAYLRSINYNLSCTWIVQFINNIPTDVMFTTQAQIIYVPNFAIIEQLYTSYITTKGSL